MINETKDLPSPITHKMTLQRCLDDAANVYMPIRSALKKWVNQGLSRLNSSAEVCLRIVHTAEMQALNKIYRKKDKPTNVLSFPSEFSQIPEAIRLTLKEKQTYLGDIILCADIIHQEALDQHKAINDHWAHLVIHGLLHLQGYDHEHDEEATVMENLEISLLHTLNIKNPYEAQDLIISTQS